MNPTSGGEIAEIVMSTGSSTSVEGVVELLSHARTALVELVSGALPVRRTSRATPGPSDRCSIGSVGVFDSPLADS